MTGVPDKPLQRSADVGIIGGGLAGLTLALQLKQADEAIDVVVLERRRHPAPDAIHKVGESTVEIGAEYLADMLGQRAYLEASQLPKFGLRYFFGATDGDLATADELGSSHLLPVHSFQLDRGPLENHLACEAQRLGVEFRDNTRVTSVALHDDGHQIQCQNGGQSSELRARWLIDAASRSSPLKRHLELAMDNDHDGFAVWFRVAGRIAVDDWSDNADWHARCPGGKRWLSTNHLMGPGYWLWIIPLASGATSIGVVADPAQHAPGTLRTLDDTLRWITKHQPRCAEALQDREVLDFHFMRRYSYDCRQVFSDQRWGLTGESGVFLDPYYSPGTDFIAIANTWLTDLIVRERHGERIAARNHIYQELYFSFYRNTMLLFRGQYPGFGDRHLLTLKTVWDFAYYWGILACLFINGALTDLAFMARAERDLLEIQRISRRLQKSFRERAARCLRLPPDGRFIDQSAIPIMYQLNAELAHRVPHDKLLARIQRNVAMLSDVATMIQNLLDEGCDAPVAPREQELLGELRLSLA